MDKYDITEHSDNELSLIVMNDEYFYKLRHRRNFLEVIEEFFIYTSDQLDVLVQDLEEDAKELDL